MSLNLKFARAYAQANVAVFPLIGKAPATQHGFKDATTDLNQIDQWWNHNPHYNIGAPVKKHTIVLDIDPRAGGQESITKLEQEHGNLPATNTCVTGRGDGGYHLYYSAPPPPFTGKNLPPGIDLRVAERAYLVMPPSIHPDTGGHYYWTGPEARAELPPWLLNLLKEEYKPLPSPEIRWDLDGNKLINFVTTLPSGQRNSGFFWAVSEAIKDTTWAHIKGHMIEAAQHIGLPDTEIQATIASAERRATT